MPHRNGHNPMHNRPATRRWGWRVDFPPPSCDDEPILMDVTLDNAALRQGQAGAPGTSNNCDPDVGDGGAVADRRYFYHQDGNWIVSARTETAADSTGTNSRPVERCGEKANCAGNQGCIDQINKRIAVMVKYCLEKGRGVYQHGAHKCPDNQSVPWGEGKGPCT